MAYSPEKVAALARRRASPFDLTSLPEAIKSRLSGYDRRSDFTGGWSTADVFRFEGKHRPSLFLKLVKGDDPEELCAEKERIMWLEGRLAAPRVEAYVETPEGAYLLTSAIPGVAASSVHVSSEGDAVRLARLLAAGLRQVHSVPIAACPFDMTLAVRMEAARANVMAGRVDESNFEAEYLGRSASALFDELMAKRPPTEDLVFTHGDYCLPNVILEGESVSGFIDLGRAGVADRYQDIALAIRSLRDNLGHREATELAFCEEYGIGKPETEKVEFYILMDEFF